MSKYPRETGPELVLFDPVLVNGEPSVDFTWQLVEENERPSLAVEDWDTPVDAGGGDLGFMLQPVAARGIYRVFVKIVAAGQTIIVQAGEVERT